MLQDPAPRAPHLGALGTQVPSAGGNSSTRSAALAKSDDNLRVRRYALGVLKGVAELMRGTPRRGG